MALNSKNIDLQKVIELSQAIVSAQLEVGLKKNRYVFKIKHVVWVEPSLKGHLTKEILTVLEDQMVLDPRPTRLNYRSKLSKLTKIKLHDEVVLFLKFDKVSGAWSVTAGASWEPILHLPAVQKAMTTLRQTCIEPEEPG